MVITGTSTVPTMRAVLVPSCVMTARRTGRTHSLRALITSDLWTSIQRHAEKEEISAAVAIQRLLEQSLILTASRDSIYQELTRTFEYVDQLAYNARDKSPADYTPALVRSQRILTTKAKKRLTSARETFGALFSREG